MFSYVFSLALIAGFSMLQVRQAPESSDWLTPLERSRLLIEQKIDNRIKIYRSASERYKTSVAAAVKKQEYAALPAVLQSWTNLLDASREDIDASINRKKKSKTLKNYEIQIRKSINDLQAFRTSVPVEIFDQFESWLNRAERVRSSFVDILFPK